MRSGSSTCCSPSPTSHRRGACSTSCGAELDVLRRQLTDVLAKAFTPIAGTDRRRAGADAGIRPRHSAGDDARRRRRARSTSRAEACSCSCCRRRTVTPRTSCARRASSVCSCCACSRMDRRASRPTPPAGSSRGAPSTDPLQAYASDLVARAAAGQIDPLIGRALEIERMIQVLCRRRKNNPLLVGEPGVGKTALAEGLALRIHQGEVPDVLKGAQRLRARSRGARRRHAVSRRLRRARQAGARSTREGRERDSLHRRDPFAGWRRRGVRRGDGCRQSAQAGAGERVAALHRFDDVQRREAVVRSRPRAVAPIPEDRRPRAIRRRDARDSQGTSAALRSASRRSVRRRGARGGGVAVGSSPAGPASAGQGDRCPRRGWRGAEAAACLRETLADRRGADRADRREDGASAGADRVERRQARARSVWTSS